MVCADEARSPKEDFKAVDQKAKKDLKAVDKKAKKDLKAVDRRKRISRGQEAKHDWGRSGKRGLKATRTQRRPGKRPTRM
jgi:hypothetical protein